MHMIFSSVRPTQIHSYKIRTREIFVPVSIAAMCEKTIIMTLTSSPQGSGKVQLREEGATLPTKEISFSKEQRKVLRSVSNWHSLYYILKIESLPL
jgi:hypothetical protein